jgi:hypothetical protein
MNISAGYLMASLFWGSIGTGFFIYGWKQQSPVPLAGGLVLVAASYFINSPLYLCVTGIATVGGIIWLKRYAD